MKKREEKLSNYKPLNVKIEAIKRKKNGESVIDIANSLKVGRTTVYDWLKQEEKIKLFAEKIENKELLNKIKKIKKGDFEVLENALWIWFRQERRKGTILNGPIIKAKAEKLYESISSDKTFVASNGWFERWKERFGIRFITACGERFSADINSIEKFVNDFQQLIENYGYHPEQVYNFDETGICPKLIPNKTFTSSEEKTTSNFKTIKDRITAGLAANVTGKHKLKPFIIGKFAKPRALKNIIHKNLPVYYRSQKSAWMNIYLFDEWFKQNLCPAPKKI